MQEHVSKKLRRKESNRESARRSRLRKAEGEEKKQAEIVSLTQALQESRQVCDCILGIQSGVNEGWLKDR